MKQLFTQFIVNSMPTAGAVTHASRRLKSFALTIAMTIIVSGCSMTTLKQCETTLSQQQQQLAEQQKKQDQQQLQLQQERKHLAKLNTKINQEQKRLTVLKKSLSLRTVDSTADQTSAGSHVVIGQLEYVYLSPPGTQLSARIDTGAKTSSLNALDLTEFERDGKPYARFNIIDPVTGNKIKIERRIKRRVKIKEHQGEAQSRPIVKMRVRLGNLDQRIEMTLTDRSEFKNQVLIGRNFLRDFAIVDVGKQYLSNPVIEEN